MRKKIYILDTLLRETQARFPHINVHKFEVLYHGWRWEGIRNGRNTQFFTVAWKRGWLSQKDADVFRKYIGIV